MAKLKKNLNKITDDTKVLVEDYLRLLSGKFSEKLALFLGILASVFVLFILIIVLVIFSSFALAGYLNKVLPGEYWGYGIVSGIYLLTIVLFIVKIFRTKTPLFSNLFVKLIVTVMNIDLDQSGSIKGLKKEHERVQHKIEADKTKIEADFQILKHGLIGNLLKEFLAVFTPKKRTPEAKAAKKEAPEKVDEPEKERKAEKEDGPKKEKGPEKEGEPEKVDKPEKEGEPEKVDKPEKEGEPEKKGDSENEESPT